MMQRLGWIAASIILLASGCAEPDAPPRDPVVAEQPALSTFELPPPFTSEQIRDEWAAGLRLLIERTEKGDAPVTERWTVLEADAESVTIEFAMLDASGSPVGDPAVVDSSWDSLRDHARFAAGTATRVPVTRETALGSLDGWLYTVNEGGGLVTVYFFADKYPGAPVALVSRLGDEVVATLRQLKRDRVDNP